MKAFANVLTVLALGVFALGLSGCRDKSEAGPLLEGDEHAHDGEDAHGDHDHGDHEEHDHEGNDHEGHDHEGHDHESHDHEGHSHDHPHGPHDGELVELAGSSPGESGRAEWTHDDKSGLITVYMLDAEGKQELPIDASEVTIEVNVKGKEPVTYTLAAVSPDGDGKAARFELEDPQLLASLKLKEAVEAQLQVMIDGKNLAGKVEFIDHGHHH